jgi:hypothetical protein
MNYVGNSPNRRGGNNNRGRGRGKKESQGRGGAKKTPQRSSSASQNLANRPLPSEWSIAPLKMDTECNSEHFIDIFCFKCWNLNGVQTLLCPARGIYRINLENLFVKSDLQNAELTNPSWNVGKGVEEFQLLCNQCKFRIGNGYHNYPSTVTGTLLQAKLFRFETGTKIPAIAWRGDVQNHVPLQGLFTSGIQSKMSQIFPCLLIVSLKCSS